LVGDIPIFVGRPVFCGEKRRKNTRRASEAWQLQLHFFWLQKAVDPADMESVMGFLVLFFCWLRMMMMTMMMMISHYIPLNPTKVPFNHHLMMIMMMMMMMLLPSRR
jgi:hypothetical protein